MSQLFGIQLDTLTNILLIITCAIIVGVVLLALGNAIFFKIGVRNIPRRRTQMILIIFALMLSTTLLSSVLAVGDVITAAVQSVAIYNLGNVDETVEGGHGALGFFDDKVYYSLVKLARNYPDIAAVSAAMVEQNLLVADENSRQVRSKVPLWRSYPAASRALAVCRTSMAGGACALPISRRTRGISIILQRNCLTPIQAILSFCIQNFGRPSAMVFACALLLPTAASRVTRLLF